MQGIMLQYYATQISGKWAATHTANIHVFKSPSICSNKAVCSMCVVYIAWHDAMQYFRGYSIISTAT